MSPIEAETTGSTGPEPQSASVDGGESGSRARDVAHASTRGVVAAMTMTGVRAVTGGFNIVYEIPPQAMFKRLAPGVLKKVPRRRRDAVIEIAHWVYGGVGGAGYGLLPSRVRGKPGSGPAFGLGIWLAFELVIAPILGLREARASGGRLEQAALAADHALYGLVLAEIRPSHKATR